MLTEKGLGDAIQEYIEKDEKDSISELINYQIVKIQVSLQLFEILFLRMILIEMASTYLVFFRNT